MAQETSLFGKDAYYHHGSVRRYTAMLGALLGDLWIERTKGNKVQRIAVPIRYGSGWAYEKAQHDDGDDAQVRKGVTLPAMAFEITSMTYDADRQLNRSRNLEADYINSDSTKHHAVVPVPYNINYTLTIRTETTNEMLQIFEQIAPQFKPNLILEMQPLAGSGMDVETQAIVTMFDPTLDDNYENQLSDTRYITWSIDIEVKGHLFGRVHRSHVIREIEVFGGISLDAGAPVFRIMHEFGDLKDFGVLSDLDAALEGAKAASDGVSAHDGALVSPRRSA